MSEIHQNDGLNNGEAPLPIVSVDTSDVSAEVEDAKGLVLYVKRHLFETCGPLKEEDADEAAETIVARAIDQMGGTAEYLKAPLGRVYDAIRSAAKTLLQEKPKLRLSTAR